MEALYVYVGLIGSAVDHSDPQSVRAHVRTPVHPTVAFRSDVRFIGNITQYTVCGPELESIFLIQQHFCT